jgi:hypothetical protein
MTINKLTGNIQPLDEVDKINEIIDGKQDTLVSGTNIKTINSNSILGSGNLQLDSLPSQTGNAGKFLQTDGTDASWESAPFRNIGEIVASTIPLTDAGLHLLDGSLIQGGGVYADFVTYIAGLYTSGDYTAIFDTEANWQTAVTTYGVCGKFVYDSVNNTVRLPKYSSKIYTQELDATAPVVGNGTSLGVTDGTTNASIGASAGGFVLPTRSTYGSGVGTTFTASYITSTKSLGVTTDPTKSGLIAQLSDITTSLEGYYYIVVATSTKTDIEVDIDEIATDLNGKADVDLTNINVSCKPVDGQWVELNQSLTTATAVGTYTIDLSSYLPNDTYNYDVKFAMYLTATGSTDCVYRIYNDVLPNANTYAWSYANAYARHTSSVFDFPISSQRSITLTIEGVASSFTRLSMLGYRRIGTNQ